MGPGLNGKVALVTAASKGLGKAVATGVSLARRRHLIRGDDVEQIGKWRPLNLDPRI